MLLRPGLVPATLTIADIPTLCRYLASVAHAQDVYFLKLREFADAEGLSVDQLIASAAAEKLAALSNGTAYLRREAALASRADFECVLAKVPDVLSSSGDGLDQRLTFSR